TYTVTNTNDSGLGSLRAAVASANSTADNDVIVFNISGCPNGVCTVVLTSGEMGINAATSSGRLTISNPAGPQSVVIRGDNESRIFYINGGAHFTINGVTMENGAGFEILDLGAGGALLNYGYSEISNSILRNNIANYGGSVANLGGFMVINKSEIINSQALVSGGGIYNLDGTLQVLDSTIANNISGWEFGQGFGGGMAIIAQSNSSWTATIANCTLSGNEAISPEIGVAVGGAVFLANGLTPVHFINVTVTQNSAADAGGAVAGDGLVGASMYVRNSIFAGNTAGSYPDISTNTVLVNDLGNNIIGQPALLGPLADNGGPTRTHALLPGSPAINAGNNCVLTANGCGDGNPALSFDQRGTGRVGTVDIGAYEYAVVALYTITGRVAGVSGRPVNGARVRLDDGAGNVRLALTSSFGYFRFENVPPASYTAAVTSKRYTFAPRVFALGSNLDDIDFTAIEPEKERR
ncbi:MAG: choice-of-anchor Q domain-containing protein, partial [Pyrinomonadaceae bacterium]